MSVAGAGDRWLHGDKPEGVLFAQHDRVEIAEGSRAGQAGTIVLLVALEPEPVYLLEVDGDARPLRVRQSALRSSVPGRGR